MARTKQEIKDEVLTEKDSLLSALNSSSLFAVFNFFFDIVVSAIYTFEVILDAFKADIQKQVVENAHGNLAWYQAQALKFQYGYGLVFDNNTFVYYYTDTESAAAIASKVVTHCTAVAVAGNVVLKVAKGTAPALTKLSPAEVLAFTSYMNKIQLAGDNIGAISYDADIIRLRFQVYYDGVFDVPTLEGLIVDAINNYLQSLPFNGQIVTSDLIAIIKDVEGVNDCVITSGEIKPETGGYSQFTRTADGLSGYYQLKPVGTTTDDTNITYIAQ